MNAGFLVMTMITIMMVKIRRKARTMVMGSLFGFPKDNHKTEPKVGTKRATYN